MSRQDKSTTERNARILRELVKQPDNKACADCRKNDARWASWNLGVFLCIRCSGIHRSMGTHISRVKSIDLDIWTPEQMENIQKWGNRRANVYWEKHLKQGHVPPEHKIESFIRSKYESKRWAMEGPVPSDPRVLDGGSEQPATEAPRPTPTASAPPAAPASLPRAHPLLSRTTAPKPSPAPAAPAPPMVDFFGGDDGPALAPPVTTAPPAHTTPAPSQPKATTAAAAPGPTAPPAAAPTTGGSSIFDLDFRAPTPNTSKPQTAKADIMSLFSTASPTTASANSSGSFFNTGPTSPPISNNNFGFWGGGVTSSASPVAPTSNTVSMAGWGGMQMDQNAWGAPPQPSQPAHQQQHVQQQQQQQQQPPQYQQQPIPSMSGAAFDPWASTAQPKPAVNGAPKKDDRDPFANLWA